MMDGSHTAGPKRTEDAHDRTRYDRGGGLYGITHNTDQPWTIFEKQPDNSNMILTPIAKAYF
jgi:hypothetical protein